MIKVKTSHVKNICFPLYDQMHYLSMIQILRTLEVKHAVGLSDCAKIAVDEDGVIFVA